MHQKLLEQSKSGCPQSVMSLMTHTES